VNGNNPVVVVFAKEATGGLTSLVKKIDAATAQNKSAKMGSFVVLCSDDQGLEDKLKKLAETEKVERTILTIDNPAGPQALKLAKDADVTVLFYLNKQVKANHAFQGQLTAQQIDKVLADLTKILPEKKPN
jgi:hypothetical protein